MLKHFQPCPVNHRNRLLPTENSCLHCDRGGMRIQLLLSRCKGSWAHRGQLLPSASRPVGQGLCSKVLSRRYVAEAQAMGRTGGPSPGCAESYAGGCSAFSRPEDGHGWPFQGSLDPAIKPSCTPPARRVVLVVGSKDRGQGRHFYD